MFTARHYEAIAHVLANERGQYSMNAHRQMLDRVTLALSHMLAEDNPHFDPDLFLQAAGMWKKAT